MELLWALVFSLSSILAGIDAASTAVLDRTPEYIKPCRRRDPELDKCVAVGISHLRDYLIKGIKELDIPPIEPLYIPKIQMENGAGRIRVKAVFSNMTIHGAGNHTLTNVRSDIKNLRIDLGMKAPKITVQGRYEVSGSVLVVNIRSKGDFWATFEDVSGVAKLYGKELIQDGEKFMKMDKVNIDFKVGKARFKIRDRSSASRVLGEAINNFLNQNWREVIDEMKYTAGNAIGKYFKQILNSALQRVPLKYWLIED